MDQGSSFLEIVNKYLNSNSTTLPVFNKTGMRIQKETAKKDPDTDIIEKLISSDQALTGQVLRTANSAFFQRLFKVSTVRTAILRLGFNEVSNIVMLVTQKANFKSKNPVINETMDTLWRHSVGCAIGAQWIAVNSGYREKSHEAFSAGLLHDMGKLFILSVIDSILQSGKLKNIPSNKFLLEVMVSLHTEYGYSLLHKWNLPDCYCEIARDHHLEDLPQNNDILVMVRLANQACNKLGIGERENPEIILAATPEAGYLGLEEIHLAELEIKLEDSGALSKI